MSGQGACPCCAGETRFDLFAACDPCLAAFLCDDEDVEGMHGHDLSGSQRDCLVARRDYVARDGQRNE